MSAGTLSVATQCSALSIKDHKFIMVHDEFVFPDEVLLRVGGLDFRLIFLLVSVHDVVASVDLNFGGFGVGRWGQVSRASAESDSSVSRPSHSRWT